MQPEQNSNPAPTQPTPTPTPTPTPAQQAVPPTQPQTPPGTVGGVPAQNAAGQPMSSTLVAATTGVTAAGQPIINVAKTKKIALGLVAGGFVLFLVGVLAFGPALYFGAMLSAWGMRQATQIKFKLGTILSWIVFGLNFLVALYVLFILN